jgi:glycosyltransferase involved in cell wall biosynthesis
MLEVEQPSGGVGAARPGRRPRILILIKCLGYGGAEQLVVDAVAHRDRESFDYEVAYVLTAENALESFVADTGVTVHRLGASGDADLKWMASLRRLLVTGNFDVVHFHLPYAAVFGRLVVLSIPRRGRPAMVWTAHSRWDSTSPVVRLVNRVGSRFDDRIIAVSDSVRDTLPASARRRASVIVHGMDLGRAAQLRVERETARREVRRELGVADDEILVLAVANLRREKGYDILLEAARDVVAHGAAVRFAAAGRGPLSEEITARRDALGLGDRFQLLGQRSDALRLLAGADIFVLASHFEGLPVALMEATSVGLPIAATTVGEIPRLLTDGVDALLVPPGQPQVLASALERLASDEELRRRLGAAALARSELFDITRAVARIESLYAELIDGAP